MAGLGRGLGALLSASSRKAKNNNTSGDASSFGIVARSLAQVQGVKEPVSNADNKSTGKAHSHSLALNNLLSPRQSASDGATKSLKSRGLFRPAVKEGKESKAPEMPQEIVATAFESAPQSQTQVAPPAPTQETVASAPVEQAQEIVAEQAQEEVSAEPQPQEQATISQDELATEQASLEPTPEPATTENLNAETEHTYVQGSAFYTSSMGTGIRPSSDIPANYVASFTGQDVYTPTVSGSSDLHVYEHTTYDVAFEDGQTESVSVADNTTERLVHGDGVSEDNYLASPYMSSVRIEKGEDLEFGAESTSTESTSFENTSSERVKHAVTAESNSAESVAQETVPESVEAEATDTAETTTTQDTNEATPDSATTTTTQEDESTESNDAERGVVVITLPPYPQPKQDKSLYPTRQQLREQRKAEKEDKAYRESPDARHAVQSGSAIDQNLVREIEIGQLQASVYQPRTVFSERSLNELAESIREHGLLEPLLVSRKSPYSKRFEIICGERRFRAAQIAGLTSVPCLVREFSDENAYAVALIENIQREDLSPLEIARAYEQMMQQCKYTQEELAKSLGKSRTTVTNTLRLLRLEPFVQQALSKGKIEVGHAKILLGLTGKHQVEACKTVIANTLSVSATDVLVKDINKKLKQEQGSNPHDKGQGGIPRFSNYEKYLNRSLKGVKAKFVVKNENQGKLTLSYTSASELKYLLEVLGIPAQNPNETAEKAESAETVETAETKHD